MVFLICSQGAMLIEHLLGSCKKEFLFVKSYTIFHLEKQMTCFHIVMNMIGKYIYIFLVDYCMQCAQ